MSKVTESPWWFLVDYILAAFVMSLAAYGVGGEYKVNPAVFAASGVLFVLYYLLRLTYCVKDLKREQEENFNRLKDWVCYSSDTVSRRVSDCTASVNNFMTQPSNTEPVKTCNWRTGEAVTVEISPGQTLNCVVRHVTEFSTELEAIGNRLITITLLKG